MSLPESTLAPVDSDGPLTPRTALDRWKALEPVSIEFMLGRWRGSEVQTGHPLGGLLTVSGWYGKAFLDRETVHPLLFWNGSRNGLFAVHPKRLPMDWQVPPTPALRASVVLGRSYFGTRKPCARLRMVELHGRTSASMVYDHRPIIDGFRRIDDNRVMGLMDRPNDASPLFFALERDDATPLRVSYDLRRT